MTRTPLIAALSLALLASVPARADADAEREALARIAFDLQRVQAQVREASREAPAGARVRFEYPSLERDLELVRRGIEDHLDAPRQPRPIPPLSGDYRR